MDSLEPYVDDGLVSGAVWFHLIELFRVLPLDGLLTTTVYSIFSRSFAVVTPVLAWLGKYP